MIYTKQVKEDFFKLYLEIINNTNKKIIEELFINIEKENLNKKLKKKTNKNKVNKI